MREVQIKQRQQRGSKNSSGTSRRSRVFIRRVACGLLWFLCLAGMVLTLLPQGRAFARSALLLPALVSASEPSLLVAGGEPVQHRQMVVPSSNGSVFLDLYAPEQTTPVFSSVQSGVLIVPGVGDNRQVPQLINLSRAMARTGIVVMTMVTPTLINYDLSVQDTDAVVQAFQAFERLPGMQGKRIGMLAFSAGMPLASFGAADARIRDRVAYVTAFGGYFQTKTVLRAFGRRAIDIDGKTEHWQPTAVPILALSNIITKGLPPNEGDQIKNALAPSGKALSQEEQARLSPGGRAAYQLLAGTAPGRVEENIAALPATTQEMLDVLSPARVISQIHAPIYLLHDRNDTSLPCTESRAFAAALQALHHPYDYVEFHIFDHVEMRSHLDGGQLLQDGMRLLFIMNEMFMSAS